MSTKTTTTTTEVLADDRRRVQGIRDDGGGGSVLTTILVDWKQQRTVDFPCYRVANSNTVSSLSCRCLVLILFPSDYFSPHSLQERLSVLKSCGIFCSKCTITLRMYPVRTGE